MPTLYTVENLRLHYQARNGERTYAVDGVSFELQKGEVLGIAGESGCGKSTLVNGGMCLFAPPLYYDSGDVRIQGQSLIALPPNKLRHDFIGREIAQIPQGALNALNPTRKIKDFAADAMRSHFPKMSRREVHERLRERFDRIGLDAKRILECYPVDLSGGMKQRVVIAISTLMNPAVVIADEPTSALDVNTQKSVIELLLALMEMEIIQSMIFVTHELPLLRHVAHRVAIMYAGEFVEIGPTETVLFEPAHPYTRALMDSILLPEIGESVPRTAKALEGTPPNLQNPPEGCRFAARCPVCRPECAATKQALYDQRQRLVRCSYAR